MIRAYPIAFARNFLGSAPRWYKLVTGDMALVLPIMLSNAIATVVSRSVACATTYTTKLLRRGHDIEKLQDRQYRDLLGGGNDPSAA
ncbi:hypothetical protein ACH3VR_07755 [Microbacterium sp. B2969]|uniref:Uncharacterized protein n=1 Tax=Microbacterium alkaliflavum TaxID=3248839 RepID=A0ABW7Q9L8_9MICO